jgi:hypothetical protein
MMIKATLSAIGIAGIVTFGGIAWGTPIAQAAPCDGIPGNAANVRPCNDCIMAQQAAGVPPGAQGVACGLKLDPRPPCAQAGVCG